MKKLNLPILLFFLTKSVFSQGTNKEIHFLADTISTTKENQVLKIEALNSFEYVFTFFCVCAPPYKNYVSFNSIIKKGERSPAIVFEKPNYPFISFKDLMDIIGRYHRNFNYSFDIYITEVLPSNRYVTKKVKYMGYSPPVQDREVLKDH